MGGVIEEQALKAVMEYEHRKAGKVVSKGYSVGDWIGFTHLIQVYPKRVMKENIFDQTGRLIKTSTYKGLSYFLAKLTLFIIKRR